MYNKYIYVFSNTIACDYISRNIIRSNEIRWEEKKR